MSARTPRRFAASIELDVRFHEVDAQGVVWHGNYLQYLDLARSALMERGGLTTARVLAAGYAAPVVDCEVRYKAPLRLDDRLRVLVVLLWESVPRLDFEYEVVRTRDGVLAATGRTRQVIVDAKGELVLVLPGFLAEWERRLGLGPQGDGSVQ